MKKFISLLLSLVITISAFTVLPFATSAEVTLDENKAYVLIDGKYFEAKKGDIFTYNYYLRVDGLKIASVDARVDFDDSGLKFLPDVDEYGDYDLITMFPITKDAVVNFDMPNQLMFNYSSTTGVRFPKDDSILFTGKFEVIADSGVFEIDSHLVTLGDSDLNKLVFKGEMLVELTETACAEGLTVVEEQTEAPTQEPTQAETEPTEVPTQELTQPETEPTEAPTQEPTQVVTEPTEAPTQEPTQIVTEPTEAPTQEPTQVVTEPTEAPTQEPTQIVTEPTEAPTQEPTQIVTEPTEAPTQEPTQLVTEPTEAPTQEPTQVETEPTEGPKPVPLEGRLYLINSANWNTVSAYAWVDAHINAQWPGVVMTKTDKLWENGAEIYVLEFVLDYDYIIFSDAGSNQTDDLVVPDEYIVEGYYYDNLEHFWCSDYIGPTQEPTNVPTETETDTDEPSDEPTGEPTEVETEQPTNATTVTPTQPQSEPTQSTIPDDTFNVYLINEAMWEDIYVFAWSETEKTPDWPGVKMELLEIDYLGYEVYKINLAEYGHFTNLIFSDAGKTYTAELKAYKEGFFNNAEDRWVYTPIIDPTEEPTDPPTEPVIPDGTFNVFLVNEAQWNKAYIYGWSDTDDSVEWPGIEMELVGITDEGHEVYWINLMPIGRFDYIIFSDNGQAHTANLEPTKNGFYNNASGNWSQDIDYGPIEDPTEPIPDPEFPLGDVDGNGKVEIIDATLLQKHIAAIITLSDESLARADVNSDTKMDVLDATLIQKLIAGIITEFKPAV